MLPSVTSRSWVQLLQRAVIADVQRLARASVQKSGDPQAEQAENWALRKASRSVAD